MNPLPRTFQLAAIAALILVSGCGSSSDGPSSLPVDTSSLVDGPVDESAIEGSGSLVLASGQEVLFAGMQCIYRQSFGAYDDLELQFQFLDDGNGVAFAAYLTNIEPAAVLTDEGKDADEFKFELFVDGTRYETAVQAETMSIQLDQQLDPASTEAGTSIDLTGNLNITEMSIPARDFGDPIDVLEQSIPFGCTTTFQRSEVLD